MNIVCYENIDNISDIEVEDLEKWHEYTDFNSDADDFIIRIKKD